MRHFWKKDRAEPFGLQAHHHHYGAGLAATGRWIVGQQDPTEAKDNLFRARDWVGVTQLLENEARSKGPANPKEPRDDLASSLVELRASLNSPVLWTGPIADQLVGVWALAEQVDPEAAKPAEVLLCAMEGCDLVSAGQVRAACDQLEAAVKRPARSRWGCGGACLRSDQKIS